MKKKLTEEDKVNEETTIENTSIGEENSVSDTFNSLSDTAVNFAFSPIIKFPGKLNLDWELFDKAFYCIAVVHETGNIKYSKYSWLNTPQESYGTCIESLNSLDRHLTLYSLGVEYDSEFGMHHMALALTRVHMYLSIKYRERIYGRIDNISHMFDLRENVKKLLNFCIAENNTKIDDNIYLIDQISPELRISAYKYNKEIDSVITEKFNTLPLLQFKQYLLDTVIACSYQLRKEFLTMQSNKSDITSINITSSIFLEDMMFYCLTWIINKIENDAVMACTNFLNNIDKYKK